MANQLQLRRGNTAAHATFVGGVGEVTFDTDKKMLVVHDGEMVGGYPVGKGAIQFVEDVKRLLDIDTSLLEDGSTFVVTSYHGGWGAQEVATVGGGIFVFYSQMPKSMHNGGTVISTSKDFPVEWGNKTQQEEWFYSEEPGKGCWVRQLNGGTLHASWFGIIGDDYTDNTPAIKRALETLAPDGEDASPWDFNQKSGELKFGNGIFRITETIRVPAWVIITGNYSGAISATIADNTNGSVIMADFQDEKQCAVTVAGKWLSGGKWINPAVENVDGVSYNNGKISRRYGTHIRDITVATRGNVYAGVGFAGCPGFKMTNVGSFGFLIAFVGSSSWGVSCTGLSGEAKIIGFKNYNLKACTIEGYINKMPDDNDTPPWENTDIQVYPENALHNPVALRYLSTGFYEQYSSANRYKLTLEGWERAIFGANVYSAHWEGAYIEKIGELPVHAVGCNYVFNSPRIMVEDTQGTFRVSSGGDTTVTGAGIVANRWDYGSQTSYGAVAQLNVNLSNPQEIPATEVFSEAVNFNFADYRYRDLTVYVSDEGDDTYTGLNSDNSVQSLHRAIELAKYYGASNIEVAEGSEVAYSENKTISGNLRIYSTGSGATIHVDPFKIITLDRGNIELHKLSITKTVGSSVSVGALFKLASGLVSATLSDCTYDFESGVALFIPDDNAASILMVSLVKVNQVTNYMIGRNNYGNLGSVKVIYNQSADSIMQNTSFSGSFTTI